MTLAVSLALIGCGGTRQPAVPLPPLDAQPLKPGAAAVGPDYRLPPGDLLRVKFMYHPELDVKLPVRPDGGITMQMAGDVHVEGLTTAELERVIVERTSDRLREPEVSVIVADVAEQKIFVVVADFMAGRAAPEALLTRLDRYNFSVIHAGLAPQPGAELEFLSGLLTRLRPQFDFIVIDGPPVNRYADVSVIAPAIDGVIMVVEADRTPLADAEAATRELGKVGARILGVVLKRRRSYIPAFLESLL